MGRSHNAVTPEQFDAVHFDLDGVLTEAAKVHAACWEKMFDARFCGTGYADRRSLLRF